MSEALAHEALDYFVNSRRQKKALRWVRIDRFPREVLWAGRAAREAWEKSKEVP